MLSDSKYSSDFEDQFWSVNFLQIVKPQTQSVII